MRFITEFESPGPRSDYWRNPTEDYPRFCAETQLGREVACSFGYEEQEKNMKLEIEAFPMDTWILFKRKLFYELEKPNPDAIKILEMIKELESFGNPAEEAK